MHATATERVEFVLFRHKMMKQRHLTPAEIRDIVAAAIEGPVALDTLLANALFGGTANKPRYDRDWPESARNAWYAATKLYISERRRANTPSYEGADRHTGHRERNPPTLEQSWSIVLGFRAPDTDPASVPGATWTKISALCNVSARAAAYHFAELGWRFVASGRTASNRRIVEAPCRGCGTQQAFLCLNSEGYCTGCIDRSGHNSPSFSE